MKITKNVNGMRQEHEALVAAVSRDEATAECGILCS